MQGRLNKIYLSAVLFFLARGVSWAYPVWEAENLAIAMDTYLRQDFVVLKNVVDLDNNNSDDNSAYLGIDYSLALSFDFKESGPTFYLEFERNGPFDYDAPLFIHNTLMTSGGQIERYRGEELLPQLEEFWLDTPLFNTLGLKAGLYTYQVGYGFAVNGGYENYGLSIYREAEGLSWQIYYCRPDAVYKTPLGPRIPQEKDQDILYEHGAANFFSADLKLDKEKFSLQPYVSMLADYTSEGKRDNLFTAHIKKDLLGTLGIAGDFSQGDLSLKIEMARNFGKGYSGDPAYKDIQHTGYLFYTSLEYNLDKITPSLQFLVCSGNRATLEEVQNEDETSGSSKNRAFSYFSPLNTNLGDSIGSWNTDMLPIVAMGGGDGLNYGVPRPKTFSSGDFENLIMPCLGLEVDFSKRLSLGFFAYYLRAFEKPAGTWEGEPKYLSRDLGYEADLFINYQLNRNIMLGFLGGYFWPGRYYKEKRDDSEGSLFSPFVRGDGSADPAYQIELALEFKF